MSHKGGNPKVRIRPWVVAILQKLCGELPESDPADFVHHAMMHTYGPTLGPNWPASEPKKQPTPMETLIDRPIKEIPETDSVGERGESEGREDLFVNPTSKTKPKPSTAKPRTQIGAYTPSEFEIAKAQAFWTSKGRNDLVASEQIEQFHDHHLKTGSVMADWPAAWRTWYRNALQMTKEPRRERQNAHDKFLAGGLMALEKFGVKPDNDG